MKKLRSSIILGVCFSLTHACTAVHSSSMLKKAFHCLVGVVLVSRVTESFETKRNGSDLDKVLDNVGGEKLTGLPIDNKTLVLMGDLKDFSIDDLYKDANVSNITTPLALKKVGHHPLSKPLGNARKLLATQTPSKAPTLEPTETTKLPTKRPTRNPLKIFRFTEPGGGQLNSGSNAASNTNDDYWIKLNGADDETNRVYLAMLIIGCATFSFCIVCLLWIYCRQDALQNSKGEKIRSNGRCGWFNKVTGCYCCATGMEAGFYDNTTKNLEADLDVSTKI